MSLRRWLDVLMGRPRLIEARPEKLFALSTARQTLEEQLGWDSTGRSGLCLKPVVTGDYARAQQEIADLVRMGAKETKSRITVQQDSFGYTWILLEDPQFEDLLTLTHMAVQTLEEQGFGTQILSAVFGYRLKATHAAASGGESPDRIYLIYNYKRGVFYPFLPKGDGRESAGGRLVSGEFHAASTLGREMPVEKDPSRWYPIWGCPV